MSTSAASVRGEDNRKRHRREDEENVSEGGNEEASALAALPSASSTTTLTIASGTPSLSKKRMVEAFLETELATVRSELERERSLRSMDTKRHERTESRLRRQVSSLLDEVEDSKQHVSEIQQRHEGDLSTLREARRSALQALSKAEAQLAAAKANSRSEDEDEEEKRSLRQQNDILKCRLKDANGEIDALRLRVKRSEEIATENQARASNRDDSGDQENITNVSSLVSDAPPDVMKELNRVRVQLANTERSHRQLQHKLDLSVKASKKLMEYKERSIQLATKLQRLQEEQDTVQKRADVSDQVGLQWTAFRAEILKYFPSSDNAEKTDTNTHQEKENDAAGDKDDNAKNSLPPEVSTIVRHLRFYATQTKELKASRDRFEQDFKEARRHIATLESQLQEKTTAERKLSDEHKDVALKLRVAELDVLKLRKQQSIWKQEADSMRALVEANDVLALKSSRGGGGAAAGKAATATELPSTLALRAQYESSQEEIRSLTNTYDSLQKELHALREEDAALKKEHERVLDKFGKLRAALEKERTKAAEAEERAAVAESLAGQGSYNTQTTRVLHLVQNPLTDAMKQRHEQEVAALKKALAEGRNTITTTDEAASSTGMDASMDTSSSSAGGGIDEKKVLQRMKDQYIERSVLYREGVYLLTGCRIDMSAGETDDKLVFKVRSMYAEREEDFLLFSTKKRGVEVRDMVVLETDYVRQLTTDTSIFDYVSKFKSLPAFLASTTLHLFEKQTFMG